MADGSDAAVVRAMDDGAPLVCEGYLHKLRGFFQTRRRWFRLTSEALAFYECVWDVTFSCVCNTPTLVRQG